MNITLYSTSDDERKMSKTLTVVKSINAIIKENNSVIRPSLVVESFTNWEDVNYIYIPDFERYYFVRNIRPFTGNRLSIECEVDVLMSYKSSLLSLKCIINKQESSAKSKSDMYIDDGSFVTETRKFNTIINYDNGFNEQGQYILITAGKVGGE